LQTQKNLTDENYLQFRKEILPLKGTVPLIKMANTSNLYKGWNGTSSSTKLAMGAILLVVVILVICLIVRALRNKKRLESASASAESDSRSRSDASRNHQHPRSVSVQAAAPVPAVQATPKVEAPKPTAVPQVAQPARVVGNAGFVQKTCGDDINCSEPKVEAAKVETPATAPQQQVPVRQAPRPTPITAQPQMQLPQKPAGIVIPPQAMPPQVQKVAPVVRTPVRVQQPVIQQQIVEEIAEVIEEPKAVASVARKASRFTGKNDDE
jgi:hypothetical protein